jgi:uncharacterized protein with von Willebrand factor type A (vWA) domain
MNKALGQELLEVEFGVFDKAMEAYSVDKEKEVEDIDRAVVPAGSEVDQVDRVRAVVLAGSEVDQVDRVRAVVLADSEVDQVDKVKAVVLAGSEVDQVDRVRAVVPAGSEVDQVDKSKAVMVYKEDQARMIVVGVLRRTLEEGGMIVVVDQVFDSEGAEDFPVEVHHLASC